MTHRRTVLLHALLFGSSAIAACAPTQSSTDASSPPPDSAAGDAANPHDASADAWVRADVGADARIDAFVVHDAASDAGNDASDDAARPGDAWVPDAGTDADVATMFSYESPLQVDFTSIYDVDSVASSAPTGQSFPPLFAIDAGSGAVFFTASVGSVVDDFAGGLPDDALFASNADHPEVQLGWRDDSVAPNSTFLSADVGGHATVTVSLLATPYHRLYVFLTSMEGASDVDITLTYADTTTSTASVRVVDWFDEASAAPPTFVLADGLSRFIDGSGVDFRDGGALYGVGLDVDVTRTLTSCAVTFTGGTGRGVMLYGATAY